MQPSEASIAEDRGGTEALICSNATQTLEQMLEAEIMGTSVYPDEPELTPLEERLLQLQYTDAVVAKTPGHSSTPDRNDASGTPSDQQAFGLTEGTEVSRPDIILPAVDVRADGGSARPYRASLAAAVRPATNPAGFGRNWQLPRLSWLYVSAVGLFVLSWALFAYWEASDRDALTLPYAKVGIVEPEGAISLAQDLGRAPMENDDGAKATVNGLSSVAPSKVVGLPDVVGRSASYPTRKVRLYRVDGAGNILGYVEGD